MLRRRLKDFAREIERKFDDHEVGKLLTTIDGGRVANRRLSDRRFGRSRALAQRRRDRELCRCRATAAAIRAKRFSCGSPTIPLGNARLRRALWMVVLNAVRCNPWLGQYYERLRTADKPGKVAVITAMRKLLAAVWSVVTHRCPFVPYLSPTPTTASAATNNA